MTLLCTQKNIPFVRQLMGSKNSSENVPENAGLACTIFYNVLNCALFSIPIPVQPSHPKKKTNKKLPYLGLFYPEVNIKSSPPRLLKPMTRPPTVNYPFSRSTFARLSCFSSFPAFPTHFTTPWDAGSCLSAWNSWESVALSLKQPPQTSLIPYINRKWEPSWGEGSENVYLPSNLLFIWVLCATKWSGDLSSVVKCVKLYSYWLFQSFDFKYNNFSVFPASLGISQRDFFFYLLISLHEKMTFETLPVGHSSSISSHWEWSGWNFSPHCNRKEELLNK